MKSYSFEIGDGMESVKRCRCAVCNKVMPKIEARVKIHSSGHSGTQLCESCMLILCNEVMDKNIENIAIAIRGQHGKKGKG